MVKINPELHEFRNIAHQILAAVVGLFIKMKIKLVILLIIVIIIFF